VEELPKLTPRSVTMLAQLRNWDSGSPATVTAMVPACLEADCVVWHARPSSPHSARTHSGSWARDAFERGTLPKTTTVALASRLAHFAKASRWVFAVWDGYGWQPSERAPIRLQIPHRALMTFVGQPNEVVSAAVRSVGFQSPTMWWPSHCEWAVRTDVDSYLTVVGASAACVKELLADKELVAQSVNADDPMPTLELLGPPH
jgi:hypothetical protein